MSEDLFAGRYILEESLGEGGMGKVIKARYASSNYPCAIKLLLDTHRDNEEIVSRFVNEAKISNHIGHPGVCRVIDVGWTEDETPYLVMELLDGDAVDVVLERKGGLLTIGEALRIVRQILEVLAAAHDKGIVHRDIKPDNVFITRDGSVKLLDFGVARMSGVQLTRVGAPIGTVGYMPPEIARGETRESGPSADVWSAGAMLFQLLTGELPLELPESAATVDVLRATATQPARSLAKLLPRCPARLVKVADRMLAFDKDERCSAPEALAALRGVLLPAELIGQTAPWVWDPEFAARPPRKRKRHESEDDGLDVDLAVSPTYRSGIGLATSSGSRRLYVVGDTGEGTERRYDPDDEVEELHERIRADPASYDDYHRLVELYLTMEQRDAAIAVARTLRFLKHAKPEELALAEELDGIYRPPRAKITRKQWREVLMGSHPSAQLSALLARLWPVLAAHHQLSYADLGLEPSSRVAVSMEERGLPRWLAYTSLVLDMPAPDLLRRPGERGGFRVTVVRDGQTLQPTLVAGEDALAAQPPAARAFRIGRALAYAHPYLIGSIILPSSVDLRDAIHGAAALTSPEIKIPAKHLAKAHAWRDAIAKMLIPDRVESLRKSVSRVVGMGGGDTKAWLHGCQHTAARVGLLMSDDIGVAARVLTRGDPGTTEDKRELIKDLVAFSVSAAYLELRRNLKIV